MNWNFYYLIYLCLITSCVSNDASKKGKNTTNANHSSTQTANDESLVSIAPIHQRLYLRNKFKNTESIELKKNNPLNTIGITKAFQYNYLARTKIDGSVNPDFHLAVYQYEEKGNIEAAMGYYMEIASIARGRVYDFLLPSNNKIFWLHADCTLPVEDWNRLKEAVIGTLEEVPKSIYCECQSICKYQ